MNIDLNKLPKNFVDNVIFGFGKDHFVFAIFTGENITSFALGRTAGKEFLRNLQKTVEESEKMYGEIETNSGIPSPIQIPPPGTQSDTKK